jgi:hypothetical protein
VLDLAQESLRAVCLAILTAPLGLVLVVLTGQGIFFTLPIFIGMLSFSIGLYVRFRHGTGLSEKTADWVLVWRFELTDELLRAVSILGVTAFTVAPLSYAGVVSMRSGVIVLIVAWLGAILWIPAALFKRGVSISAAGSPKLRGRRRTVASLLVVALMWGSSSMLFFAGHIPTWRFTAELVFGVLLGLITYRYIPWLQSKVNGRTDRQR